MRPRLTLITLVVVLFGIINYQTIFSKIFTNLALVNVLNAVEWATGAVAPSTGLDPERLLYANSQLKQAQAIQPSADQQAWVARIDAFSGDWHSALNTLNKAWVEMSAPRQYLFSWFLAEAYEQTENPSEADRIRQIYPETTSFLLHKAAELLALGRLDEAIMLAERAERISAQPMLAKASIYQGLCVQLRDKGPASEAIAWCERLLTVNQGTGAHILLGRAYLAAREFSLALPTLERAIEYDAGSFAAWNYLGDALTGLTRYEEADRAYLTSLSLNPDYVMARLSRADLLALTGKKEQARAEYQQLQGVLPSELLAQRLRQLESAP